MGFILQITRGPEAGQSLRFDAPQVTFGRTAENDVVLNDPGISRRHMSITAQGGGHVLRDLGSSNGTVVNGQRVEQHVLRPGDTIEAGAATFTYSLDARGGVPARRPRAAAAAPSMAEAPRTSQNPRPSTPARRPPPQAPSAPSRAAPPAPVLSASAAPARKAKPDPLDPSTWPGRNARERFHARRASKTPVGRARFWYSQLPAKQQKLVLAGGGLVALLLVLMVAKGSSGPGTFLGPSDYSGQVLELTSQVTEREVFGFGLPEITAPSRSDISFGFRYLGGRATLRYDVGWVDSKTEVEIRVNEHKIVATAPVAIQTWVNGNEIILPRDALKANDVNVITFDNIKNPGTNPAETWGLRWIQIVEDPLPEANPALAMERFQLGDKRWAEREIGPRNTWDACVYFAEARDLLEKLELKPPLYDEASARSKECTSELNRIYQKMTFDAMKAERFREWEKARGILQQIVKYFPEESDPRHQEIKTWLKDYKQ